MAAPMPRIPPVMRTILSLNLIEANFYWVGNICMYVRRREPDFISLYHLLKSLKMRGSDVYQIMLFASRSTSAPVVLPVPVCYIRSAGSKPAGVCWSNGEYEIPNSKHQITNKSQIPIQNDQNSFGILNTSMHIAPHDSYMSPPPSRDWGATSHPGQVRRRRTRAWIQTTSPRRRGTRHQMTSLNFYWIPDLVRNDGFGEL